MSLTMFALRFGFQPPEEQVRGMQCENPGTDGAKLRRQKQERMDRADRRVERQAADAAREKKRRRTELRDLESDKGMAALRWPCQRVAFKHVSAKAQLAHEEALPRLAERVQKLGFTAEDVDRYLTYIRDSAPIIIHIPEEVLHLMVKDPMYRSVFETRKCPWQYTRARKHWEDALFNRAYTNARSFQRPKYGCLNITRDTFGVSAARKTFGNLFLTLAPSVRHRSTFGTRTNHDVHRTQLGTHRLYAHVLMEYTDRELFAALKTQCDDKPRSSECFKTYKECQIHGAISIADDVAALSLPGCEANASAKLAAAVRVFQQISGCQVTWQGDVDQSLWSRLASWLGLAAT